MIKHPKRRFERILNLGHRYFVYTSVAFTLVTTGFIGLRFYHHFKLKQEQRKIQSIEQQQGQNAENLLEKFADIDDVPKKIATSNF